MGSVPVAPSRVPNRANCILSLTRQLLPLQFYTPPDISAPILRHDLHLTHRGKPTHVHLHSPSSAWARRTDRTCVAEIRFLTRSADLIYFSVLGCTIRVYDENACLT